MESHGRKQIHVFSFNCASIHDSLLDGRILFGCLVQESCKTTKYFKKYIRSCFTIWLYLIICLCILKAKSAHV